MQQEVKLRVYKLARMKLPRPCFCFDFPSVSVFDEILLSYENFHNLFKTSPRNQIVFQSGFN